MKNDIKSLSRAWARHFGDGFRILIAIALTGFVVQMSSYALAAAGSLLGVYLPFLNNPWAKGSAIIVAFVLIVPVYGYLFRLFDARLNERLPKERPEDF